MEKVTFGSVEEALKSEVQLWTNINHCMYSKVSTEEDIRRYFYRLHIIKEEE